MKKILLFSFLALCMSACGVKPSNVDAPPGSEDTVFPQTYPAPQSR